MSLHEHDEGDSEKHIFCSSRPGAGPHKLGDPNDLSLRKIEKSVLIPELMRKKARTESCKDLNLVFANCAKENGLLMTFQCQKESEDLKSCIKKYFEDPEFKKLCTKEYLEDRSEYRRTGIGKKQREAEKAAVLGRAQSKE